MAVSILLEGPEGAGKSTICTIAYKLLEETSSHPLLFVHEPGSTLVGEAIRGILHGDTYKEKMSATTIMLLYTAARAQLFEEKIIPFSNENPNGIILSDRSWPSTFALQTVDGVPLEYIESVQSPFMKDYPTKLLFIDIAPEESRLRALSGARSTADQNWRDRVPLSTYQAIRNEYHKVIKSRRNDAIILNGFDTISDLVYVVYKTSLIAASDHISILPKDEVSAWVDEFVLKTEFFPEYHFEHQEKTRRELGYPDREVLKGKMAEEWISLGWGEARILAEREG